MRIVFFKSMVCLVLLTSCIKETSLSPPYEGDKLMINGYICASEGVVIRVTHTQNPTGSYYYDKPPLVTDALVDLYEDSTLISSLTHYEDGYYLPADTINLSPTPGRNYHIAVSSPKYGTATSKATKFPGPLTIPSLRVDSIGILPNHNRQPGAMISFNLQLNSNSPTFIALHLSCDDREYRYFWGPDAEFTDDLGNDCIVEHNNVRVQSNECGLSTSDTLRYIFQHQIRSSEWVDGERVYHYQPLNPQFWVYNVGREFFLYMKSMNEEIFLEDLSSPEPSMHSTNINGGYGLFYSRNGVVIDIPEFDYGND